MPTRLDACKSRQHECDWVVQGVDFLKNAKEDGVFIQHIQLCSIWNLWKERYQILKVNLKHYIGWNCLKQEEIGEVHEDKRGVR